MLVEHYFRHEYGRVVASLVKTFGPGRLALIEDSVQSALALALTSWSLRGVPERPGAWLTRVARNQVVDHLRRGRVAERVAQELPEPAPPCADPAHFPSEINDDLLRMLFVCCDEALAPRTQLVLALKVLCGFSVHEIALRLMSSKAAVRKRISRGREQLKTLRPSLESPAQEQLAERLAAVHHVLYLLFNEGYSSAIEDRPVRRDLCEEALRLTRLLAAHPAGDRPTTWALLALMLFHHARVDSRHEGGQLLLLEEQDRSLWDGAQIRAGLSCLARSGAGTEFSRYHGEAAVLAEHCLAPSYEQTNWAEIVDLYELLERLAPSPLYTLNRAIALAEWKGPEVGLRVLREMTPPGWLARYYLWDAALGELSRRAGALDSAERHLVRALDAAPTRAERERIQRRLDACRRPPV